MSEQPDLTDALSLERILILDCTNKEQALDRLAESLGETSEVQDTDALIQGIRYREGLMSTGIGMGIAVPHVRLKCVTKPVMAVGICKTPLADYSSLDERPIRLIFMIAAGQTQHVQYLRLLSVLSTHFKSEKQRNALIDAPDPETFYDLLINSEK